VVSCLAATESCFGLLVPFDFVSKVANVKVTQDLRGCPPGKNSFPRRFKEKHGKLYIVGKLNK